MDQLTIIPPKYIRKILVTLQSRSFPAFLVGGCVRDMLMGKYPNDWDICTAARPEQVMEIFPGSLPTGIKHGTVTVVLGSRRAEVTTFRAEGSYADHRHPDSVSFVGELNADLSRRDFTMNAIALSAEGVISDPFRGMEDIKKQLIRCVGEPRRRFEEDALRMFRALRFSARTGFEIEKNTLTAIEEKAELARFVAPERIKEELEKLLLSSAPETVLKLLDLGLMDAFLSKRPAGQGHFGRIAALPSKPLPRWAAFCCILQELGCIAKTEDFLLKLRLDSRTVRCCTDVTRLFDLPAPMDSPRWKRLLRDYGLDAVSTMAQCSDALRGTGLRKGLKAVLKSGECFSMKHLAVSGDELLELGIEGKALGEMLRFLLDYVIDYPDNNRRELLLQLARPGEEH